MLGFLTKKSVVKKVKRILTHRLFSAMKMILRVYFVSCAMVL